MRNHRFAARRCGDCFEPLDFRHAVYSRCPAPSRDTQRWPLPDANPRSDQGPRLAPIVVLAADLRARPIQYRWRRATPQPSQPTKDAPLPKPNYAFQKRQRDLAKPQKQEEKQKKKAASKAVLPETQTQPAAPDSGKTEP